MIGILQFQNLLNLYVRFFIRIVYNYISPPSCLNLALQCKKISFQFEVPSAFFSSIIQLIRKIKMSGRRSSYQDQHSPDFEMMFEQQGFSAVQLLDIDSIVQKVKNDGSNFTKKFIQYPKIIMDVIDIALTPQQFAKQHQMEVNRDMVYRSVEILSNQSQQFYDSLTCSESKDEKMQQDEVLQQQIQQQKDYTVFFHLFKFLRGQRPIQQTPASYLVKILTTFFYQKAKQILLIFLRNKELIESIYNNLYSKSISDLVLKIIQIDDYGTYFYQKEKISIIGKLPQYIDKEKNTDLLILTLQNFVSIYQSLLEKYQDKYDKAKYMALVQQITYNKETCLFLIKKAKEYPDNGDIQAICFSGIQVMLRFNTGNKIFVGVNSKLNDSSNLNESTIEQLKTNEDLINEIQQYLISSSKAILEGQFKKAKIPYYRIIQCINILDCTFINKIIESQFILRIFISMVKSPNNNILHNIQKDILKQAIKKTDEAYLTILDKQSGFLTLVRQILSEKNSKYCYENQIYHVLIAIFKKIQEKFGDLSKSDLNKDIIEELQEIFITVQLKKKFYAQEIGGNPRKQSHNWDCQSSEIIIPGLNAREVQSKQEIISKQDIQIEVEEVNRIDLDKESSEIPQQNGNEHWFDSQLPLQSDDQGGSRVILGLNSCQKLESNEPNELNEQGVNSTSINKQKNEQQIVQQSGMGQFSKFYPSYMAMTVEEAIQDVEK